MERIGWHITTFTNSGIPQIHFTTDEKEMKIFRDEWLGTVEIREVFTNPMRVFRVTNTRE